MAYTSNYIPPTFVGTEESTVTNGALATASLVRGIASDQTKLVTVMPQCTFFSSRTETLQSTDIIIQIPPYCQYVQFAFLAVVDTSKVTTLKSAAINLNRLGGATADGSTVQVLNAVGSGGSSLHSARWAFTGGDYDADGADENDARVVKAVSSVSSTWQEATIVITIGNGPAGAVDIYSAAYKVVKPKEMTWT